MAKKDISEERIFKDKCKLYFGGISARAISFAYFNFDEDLVVISNSTTPPPNDVHGDRLMDYSVSELSFHFMYFKDKEFLSKFRNLLQIPDGVYYCVNVILVLSILNNFKLNDLEVYDNEYGDKVLINKGRSTYDKKNVVGFPVYDFHVLSTLYHWIDYTKHIPSEEHKVSHPNIEKALDLTTTMQGRIYFNTINVEDFKNSYNEPVFKDVQPQLRIVCLDGLSTPSIKQFLKKLSLDTYSIKQYMWVEQERYILSMTIFENDVVMIKSIRPNLISIPISNAIKLHLVDNYMEENYGNS